VCEARVCDGKNGGCDGRNGGCAGRNGGCDGRKIDEKDVVRRVVGRNEGWTEVADIAEKKRLFETRDESLYAWTTTGEYAGNSGLCVAGLTAVTSHPHQPFHTRNWHALGRELHRRSREGDDKMSHKIVHGQQCSMSCVW